jgi:hypothetical protein
VVTGTLSIRLTGTAHGCKYDQAAAAARREGRWDVTLTRIIIIVVVIGLVIWLLGFLPIPEPFRTIAYVLIVVGLIVSIIVWLLRYAGLDQPL